MTPTQFRAALDKIGLPQESEYGGADRLLGVSGRTVRDWCAGKRKVPHAVAILLRLLVAGVLTTEDVEKAGKRA